MSDIVFTILVNAGFETDTNVFQLEQLALIQGCRPDGVEEGTSYPLNQIGVNKLSIEQLGALIMFEQAGAISCFGQVGPRFVEMTAAEYSSLVPVSFPESTKHVGVEPDITVQQMTWSEYAPWSAPNADASKYLVEMSERAEGATCGDGLDWGEFKVWFSVFSTRILNDGQANSIRATYTQQT